MYKCIQTYSLQNKEEIHLTLERHGFELCRSIYTQIFFSINVVGPLYPQVLHPYIQPAMDRVSIRGWLNPWLWSYGHEGPMVLRHFIWGTWASLDFSIHGGFWNQYPCRYWGMTALIIIIVFVSVTAHMVVGGIYNYPLLLPIL